MAEPTIEQLELLLALQDTHSRIRRLQRQRDDLPEQRALDASEAKVGDLQRNHDEVRLELEQRGSRLRQLERETDVLVQRRDAERARLYDGSVTNQREMRSVEAEVEATQGRIEEREEELLELMERIDELERREVELETELAQTRQQVVEAVQSRDEAAKQIVAELADLEVRRDEQTDKLPDQLRERFEAAADRAGGVGVGRLDQGTCSACRIELSRADIGELLAGPPLTTCPECRRLLVVPE